MSNKGRVGLGMRKRDYLNSITLKRKIMMISKDIKNKEDRACRRHDKTSMQRQHLSKDV